MKIRNAFSAGFTLVEMSVVLVIIGLVVGSVVVGRDLIRNAELNSILSDSEKIQGAIYSFQKSLISIIALYFN